MGWEPIPKLIHTSFPDQGLTSHVPISHLLPFADSGFQVRLFFKGSSFCMRLFKNIHIGLLPPPSEPFASPWTLLLETGGFCHDILKAKGAIANDFPSCFTFMPFLRLVFLLQIFFTSLGLLI